VLSAHAHDYQRFTRVHARSAKRARARYERRSRLKSHRAPTR
jgi:hypothetical protein